MFEKDLIALGDVAAQTPNSFVDGPFGSEMKSEEYTQVGIRLIQLQNIGEGSWIDDNKKYISIEKFRSLKRHGALPGDITIAKMADPVARSCVLPPIAEQFIVVADCIKLTPDPTKFHTRFVSRAINSHFTRREAELKSSGTTRLRINLSALKTVRIWAPPFPEQSRIAAILDTVDEAIAKTEAVIGKLKQVRAGLLHDLLTRGLDENGQLRDPVAHPEQFQDSPIGRIPRGWQYKTLEDVADWASGGTPSRSQAAWWKGSMPILTPKDMKVFEISDTIEHVTDEAAQAGSKVMPSSTAFIVVRGMILAHTFPVCLSTRPFAFNQDIKAIRGREGLNTRFLAHWFAANSALFLRKATEATHGTKKLDLDELYRIYIAIPSSMEQQAIVEQIETIGANIAVESNEFAKLSLLKSALMADLLTGRVRVPADLDLD